MHQRDSLKLKVIRSNDPNVWLDFKKKRNTVNKEIKKAKKAYYLNEFRENTGNSKTWKIINELTYRKHNYSQIKEISLNGSMVTCCQKLSEAFNDHFASNGSKLSNKIHSNEGSRSFLVYLTCRQNRATLQLKETRPSIVFSLLSKLSVSKAISRKHLIL